jgi:hypothetical protein
MPIFERFLVIPRSCKPHTSKFRNHKKERDFVQLAGLELITLHCLHGTVLNLEIQKFNF